MSDHTHDVLDGQGVPNPNCMDSPEPPIPDSNTIHETISAIVSDFESLGGYGDVWIDTIYVVGSRGCPTGNVTDSSDLDLFIVVDGDESFSELELDQVANRLRRGILWDHLGEIVSASQLDEIESTVYEIDFLVFPKFDEKYELNKHMEHGGYQNVYSVTDNEYLY